MDSVVNRLIVLNLNALWQPIGFSTVKKALISMNSQEDNAEVTAAVGLDIQYTQNEDGTYNFDEPAGMVPVNWEEWTKLPVREFDLTISTPKMTIRAPTVTIAKNYAKMPMKQRRLTPQAIFERDNYTCQYSGVKLGRKELNIDHKMPKSRGGKDTWENLVTCAKEVNTIKADRTPEEAGLKLIRQPRAPLPIPVSALIRNARHKDWEIFLNK
jgi:5-methylcytosine-specific restriction endonuclease McrA